MLDIERGGYETNMYIARTDRSLVSNSYSGESEEGRMICKLYDILSPAIVNKVLEMKTLRTTLDLY